MLSQNTFILKCCFWVLLKMGFKNCVRRRHLRATPLAYFDATDQGEKQRDSFFLLLKSWPLPIPGLQPVESLADHKRKEVFLCDALF